MSTPSAFVLGGVPAVNMNVRHRIQFSVGDAVFYISLPQEGGERLSILLVRDIEMDRARKLAHADEIGCVADYEPEGGLSGIAIRHSRRQARSAFAATALIASGPTARCR